jgi:hypothetical protein
VGTRSLALTAARASAMRNLDRSADGCCSVLVIERAENGAERGGFVTDHCSPR